MRRISLTLAGVLLATAAAVAAAQTPPAPPPAMSAHMPPPIGPDADAPPFPPGQPGPRGPHGDHPPPPPLGAAIHIDKSPDGALRLDVHCAERDTTKDCADIATQLLDHATAAQKSK